MRNARTFVAALLLLVLSSACYPPLPAGRWLQADEATNLILSVYLGRQPRPHELPKVYGVRPDSTCTSPPDETGGYDIGFWEPHTKQCVWGFTVSENDRDIYILLMPENPRFSSTLPHELLHYTGHDHPGRRGYDPASEAGKLLVIATDLLKAKPKIDKIKD